jgi:ATP-binding cassette subfamily B protein/subfamily B ATP-binding cassette protein MsbA
MKYFLRSIRLSFRYKWTILSSVIVALAVALFWGASISAVYPVTEVVFQGQSMRSWFDQRIDRVEAASQQLQAEVDELRRQQKNAPPDEQGLLAGQISLLESRILVQDKQRQFYERIQPAVTRFGPATPFGTLLLVIVVLLVVTAAKGACLVLNQVLVARIAACTVADMRRIFFRQLLEMDQSKIDRIGASRLMTMLSHNVGLVQSGLAAVYGRSVREPLKMIACLIAACIICWPLLLFSLAIAPLGALLIHYLAKRMKGAASQEMRGFAAVFQTLMETLVGIKIVKIFGRQRKERHRFKNNARRLQTRAVRIALFDSLVRPISELTAIAILATAVLGGAYMVLNQQTHLFGIPMSARPLTASALLTFFAMLGGIADPARKMSDIYNRLVRAVMGSKMLFTTFDEPPEVAAPANPRPTPKHQESIRFERVSFGYDGSNLVLKDVSLEIPFGQTVAIVGINGSGKSTFINLLTRFYDPQQGTIYLDNVDIRTIRPRQLRKQISLVSQDPILFRGSVRDNIRYARSEATRPQILRAASLAHVTDFLDELPRRLQSPVGDRGSFLSGGQRQRVALARAILDDPRILILDEATSQLDAQTEQAVHESLRRFLKKRTTILITHRLSTMMLAQRVVVLRAGQVVEDRNITDADRRPNTLAKLLAKAA